MHSGFFSKTFPSEPLYFSNFPSSSYNWNARKIPHSISVPNNRFRDQQDTIITLMIFSCTIHFLWTHMAPSLCCLCSQVQRKDELAWVGSLGQEDPLQEGMAAHSSFLAWRIPWTEESGGLHPMGSQRVGHDWAADTSDGLVLLIERLYSQALLG